MLFYSLLAVLCLLGHQGQARPQVIDYPDPDEVEFVQPTVVNAGGEPTTVFEEEDRPVFVVVRRPSFGGLFPGFRNSFFNNDDLPRLPQLPSIFEQTFGGGFDNDRNDDGDLFPGFGLSDFFGPVDRDNNDDVDEDNDDDDDDDDDRNCGPLCSLFGLVKGLQGTLHNVHQSVYGNGTKSVWDDEYDLNNSTYEEKVLEDGTIVRINRTVLADKDGFGNSIYIKTFITENIDGSEDGEIIEVGDDDAVTDEEEKEVDEKIEEAILEAKEANEEEQEGEVDYPNPAENEIEMDGVDLGLTE